MVTVPSCLLVLHISRGKEPGTCLEGEKNLRLGQEAYFWGEKLGSVLFQFEVSCFEGYVLPSTMFSIFRSMTEHQEHTGEHLSFYLLQIPLPILYLISALQVSRHSS